MHKISRPTSATSCQSTSQPYWYFIILPSTHYLSAIIRLRISESPYSLKAPFCRHTINIMAEQSTKSTSHYVENGLLLLLAFFREPYPSSKSPIPTLPTIY